MEVVTSSLFLDYSSPGHPDKPERLILIKKELERIGDYGFTETEIANVQDLLLAHDEAHVKKIKSGQFFDPDTPALENIYEVAIAAVGAAIKSSSLALGGEYAFSLTRPPGHHATRQSAGGFCYFNNIAVAAKKLSQNNTRVAILDVDVHHGNGIEDIVMGDKNIVFCSLHQAPLYPGTGLNSKENCHNFPLPALTTFQRYQYHLENGLEIINNFKPDVLGISLGFDTYKHDPLAQFSFEVGDYKKLGTTIRQINRPTFFVLEGGYSEDIGLCASEFFTPFL